MTYFSSLTQNIRNPYKEFRFLHTFFFPSPRIFVTLTKYKKQIVFLRLHEIFTNLEKKKLNSFYFLIPFPILSIA